MEKGTLLVDVALSIRMLMPIVEGMKVQTTNCKSLASRLKLVKQMFEELRQSKYPLSDTTIDAFQSLHLALEQAKETLLKSSKGSKIYSVLRSNQLSGQLRTINSQIGRCLSAARLASPRVSKQIQQLAERCVQEFDKEIFSVDSLDDQIRQEIENYLLEQRRGQKVSLERLQKVAAFMDVATKEDISEELTALEKARKAAAEEKNKAEEDYIDRVISLFMQLAEDDFEDEQGKAAEIQTLQIPPDFRCPLSLELMYDPVIVASGQTYERAYIQYWLDQGSTRCPKTGQELANTALIPNYTVRALITTWCQVNNIPLPVVDSVKSKSWLAMARMQLEAETQVQTRAPEEPEADNKELEKKESDDCDSGVLSQTGSMQEIESPVMASSRRRDYSSELSGDFETLGLLSSNGSDGKLNSLRRRSSSKRLGLGPVTSDSSKDSAIQRLVEDLQSSEVEVQRAAACELRMIARKTTEDRIRIAESGAIDHLIALLHASDEKTVENCVTALLNLSLCDNNKAKIADAGAIEPLIEVLKVGNPDSKQNAAATLYSLSVKDDYKEIIGASGAIPPLVDLLKDGSPRGKKDAAIALFNLSLSPGNRLRIVDAGAVKPLIDLICEPSMGIVEKAVCALATLSNINEGKRAIAEEGGILPLVEVVEAGGPRAKEHAAAALLNLCTSTRKYLLMALQEGAIPPVYHLSQTGNARAKEKAVELLRLFRDQRETRLGSRRRR